MFIDNYKNKKKFSIFVNVKPGVYYLNRNKTKAIKFANSKGSNKIVQFFVFKVNAKNKNRYDLIRTGYTHKDYMKFISKHNLK